MTIKDVEKLTGLTAKSIRYYEDKGLLIVERNEENDYRSYSENEVNRLRRIKLLRYLEFSVEEVKSMLDMEAKEMEKVLEERAEFFSDMRGRYMDKMEMCHSLAKDYRKSAPELDVIISEYNQLVEVMESDEMAEIEENLKIIGTPSLSVTILQTLIFSGPIMWLFINISDGKIEGLMLNAVLAILSAMLVAGVWIFYFVQRSKNKNRVKKKNRATLWMFPLLILAVVLGISLGIGTDALIQDWLLPKDFLFYGHPDLAQRGMITIIMVTIISAGFLIISRFSHASKKEMETFDLYVLWTKLGKWKPAVILGLAFLFYCCVTSFTAVTEDAIICYSPIHPLGEKYSYSDVEKITTGVGKKEFTFLEHERKGEFYYQIEVKGKKIIFITSTTPNPSIKRYDDTYLWFEEFDQKLVELGVPKISDTTGYKDIDMGEEYVERFRRILENK